MVFRKSSFYFLILVLVAIWLAVFSVDNNLHIVACDVGQGDAILITRLNTQILIDGGSNQKVLDCLGKHMPFYDRTIELVILTHPEEDHYGGLIDVFKTYKIVKFGQNNTNSSSQGYQALEKLVGGSGVDTLELNSGTRLQVGMIYLDILNPIQNANVKNPNDLGIVILLKYDEFKALFMADVENKVSDSLSDNNQIKDINYLKVNHHGSKNGLSQKLLDITNPKVAVISVGKDNRYGHPDEKILEMLESINTKILRTDEIGDVVYIVKY